jgi:NADP-dependent 3-hydroxy acid dehydrogenase YdfG
MLLGPIVDAPLDEWDQMVQLNVLGLLYTAHAALPHLLRAAEDSPRKVADLVNVSSTAGRDARSGAGVYDVTKFGVVAFTESLRQEVTSRHVRVSVIEPGATATELSTDPPRGRKPPGCSGAPPAGMTGAIPAAERLQAVLPPTGR